PPVQVPGDGPGLQLGDVVERVGADVGSPVLAAGDPVPELLREGRQLEEELLGLSKDRNLAVDPRARLDQVDRVELVPAVVALVAAGLRVAADRAGALDVAVGEGPAGRGRDRAQLTPLHDVPLLVKG